MANSWYYVDGGTTSHTIFIVGTTADKGVLRGSEKWAWERENIVEPSVNRRGEAYRATRRKSGVYEISVILNRNSSSYTALETAIGTWEDWHSSELGQGYFKRITAGGTTLCLDCVPETPEWSEPVGNSIIVRQAYIAAWPWWRPDTATTASGSFNGTTPVNVACNNVGDIPSPPVITITGVIETPKIAVADGSYVQVSKTTANADDTLVITCRPYGSKRLTAWYYEHGTGAGTACQLSSASRFIELPKGNNNAVLTAASGTAGIVISWYPYYGSLY